MYEFAYIVFLNGLQSVAVTKHFYITKHYSYQIIFTCMKYSFITSYYAI